MYRADHGCDAPLDDASAIVTVTEHRIHECPKKCVPAAVIATTRAYNAGAQDVPFHEALHLSPTLIDGARLMARTRAASDAAEFELRKNNG